MGVQSFIEHPTKTVVHIKTETSSWLSKISKYHELFPEISHIRIVKCVRNSQCGPGSYCDNLSGKCRCRMFKSPKSKFAPDSCENRSWIKGIGYLGGFGVVVFAVIILIRGFKNKNLSGFRIRRKKKKKKAY